MNRMPTADVPRANRGETDGGIRTDDGGENVLVLADSMDGDTDRYCAERLSPGDGVLSPNALLVTLDDCPDERFDAVVRHSRGTPANVGIVCCDETRSAAVASGSGVIHGPGATPGPWTATVSSPGDLTGLGVRIRQALSAWGDTPEAVELCFHSLTTLLQYVDERAAFRFIHAVTRHVASVGASSHFHLDPGVVSERTVRTLSSLFDRVEDRT